MSSTVAEVLGTNSSVLDGSEYGHGSLLLLPPDGLANIEEGDVVDASGSVEQLARAHCEEGYDVSDKGVSDLHADGGFLRGLASRKKM